MTIVTNTFVTTSAVGNREQLADIIYNIAPSDTPGMTAMGRGKAKGTYEEWQTDSLRSPSGANAHIEGDETTLEGVTPTVRVGNRTQISKVSVIISGTQEVVDKAGRDSEMSYQLSKKGLELRRDMESIIMGNQSSSAGNTTNARVLGSFEAWLSSNTSRAAGGLSQGFSSGNVIKATDGSAAVLRAFSEGLLKPVLNSCYANGANLDIIMVGPSNKQTMSTFPGIATQYRENSGVKQATVLAAASIYVSDFGELKIVPNRFSRNRSALLIDTDMASVLYLRSFKTETLAKTGDAEKRHILAEYTLKVSNEGAHGVVADLS